MAGLPIPGSNRYALGFVAANSNQVTFSEVLVGGSVPFSFAAWIYTAGGVTQTIVGGNIANAIQFRVESSNVLGLIAAATTNIGFSSGTVNLNAWNHVGVTYDGTNYAFYINGSLSGSGANAHSFAGGITRIGARSGAEFFNGSISDVGIWSTVLSAGNFSSLFSGARPSSIPSSLVGYWPLKLSSSTTTPDFSGSSNTGTVSGAIQVSGPPAIASSAEIFNFLYPGAVQPNPRPPYYDPTWAYAGASIDLAFNAGNYYSSADLTGPQDPYQFLSCSRSTGGYAKTSAGTLTWFQPNALRITTNGLLVEDSRTNSLTFSQAFTHWGLTNLSVNETAGAALDGSITANTLTDNSTNGPHIAKQSFSTTSGTTYVTSVFLKNGTNRYAALVFLDNAGTGGSLAVDLQNQVITDSSFSGTFTFALETFGGWSRITIVYTSQSTGAGAVFGFGPWDGSTLGGRRPDLTGYVGTGTYIYAWGAQFEQASFASSYIPTTSAAATRAGDNVSCAGSLLTTLLGSQASIVTDVQSYSLAFGSSIYVLNYNNPGTNGIILYAKSSNSIVSTYEGTTELFQTIGASELFSTGAKVGVCWSGAGRSISGGGAAVSTDAHTFPGGATSVFLGQLTNGWYGYFRRLTAWNSRIADATLQSLTNPPSATVAAPTAPTVPYVAFNNQLNFPQHLGGQSPVRSFLYPGALQPPFVTPSPPVTTTISDFDGTIFRPLFRPGAQAWY